MSDKRPHIKPEALAGLIRQYLAGELDDKAMHDLERQALDDPFLADALEGYASHAPEQQSHQADLVSRLEARVAPEKGKVRALYYRWVAAAAILLLMFSAGWFLWEQQQHAPIAGVTPPAASSVPDSQPQGESSAISPAVPAPPALASADQPAKKVTPPAPAAGTLAKEDRVAAAEEPAPAAIPEARAYSPVPAPVNKSVETVPVTAPEKKQEPAHENYFKVPADAKKEKNGLDGNANAGNLDTQSKNLNEVVITGYGVQRKRYSTAASTTIRGMSVIQKDSASSVERALQGTVAGVSVTNEGNADDEVVYHAPAPIVGETAYDNYLRTKTVNPDNKYNGTVRVSFTVMPDGSLQDFKILRHLNDACDAEAIRVIKDGPAWAPASDRKPAKVKVRVKFTVEKE
ncbi:MAG: TonB family protein [Chitinophaga sp.]|uniref:TonB family protein n=1 Tax=Chitinophaga sp. TaxID=1869181 RepID=UPI001B12914B|nr:TonB family protein [Chitinophaga sp.]MBO9731869.1 TonB family protein [Chitinophaga sp.]